MTNPATKLLADFPKKLGFLFERQDRGGSIRVDSRFPLRSNQSEPLCKNLLCSPLFRRKSIDLILAFHRRTAIGRGRR